MSFQRIFARKQTSAPENASTVQRVKIYGERKTGTTFVTDLILKNFAVPLLSGTPDRPNRAERERLMQVVADQPAVIRRIVLDRIGDQENRRALPETLGWKHMYPPVGLLQSMPEFASETLFIVTVKHPVFWSVSYHRTPLDSVVQPRKMGFSEFLREPFVPTLRDAVEVPFYPSMVEFYADKVDGYRQLANSVPRFELVRYEDLLGDVPGFVQFLAQKYGLQRRSEETLVREVSTNRREGTFDGYREQYRLDRVRGAVSADDYDFVLERFGRERLNWLGYAE